MALALFLAQSQADARKLSVKDTLFQCAEGRMPIPIDMVFAMRDFQPQAEGRYVERAAGEGACFRGLDAKGAPPLTKNPCWSCS
jgi:hypothetical protein